ncbi:glycerophosphodiester phosphodiesterase family protein [Thermus thermamylovorans]|nr:glycerophosphodiester phosphodiesterase family protein [Thermus thermamylovorans]
MWGYELILALQSLSRPWLDAFFLLATQLGHHYAYMLILPFVYWAVDRRVGRQLAGVFLASMWLNGLLKEYLTLPRPDPAVVRHLVAEPSPGFPSGHAQGAATLWGYLAAAFRRRWLTALAVALIFLIALSRLYLGVHFPADVLGGLAIGLALVLAFRWLLARSFGARLSLGQRLALVVAVPLLLYPLYQTGTSEQILGFFLGFFAADLVAGHLVAYRERVPLGQQALKLAVGYLGFFALIALHVAFVPVGLPAVLGYSLIALWVALGAPALFRRWGLAGEAPVPPVDAGARRRLRPYVGAAALVLGLVVASSLYVRLAVPPVSPPPVLQTEGVMIIAHRGAPALAPENTLPAFQAALEQGAHMLELDVWRTRDGVVVVIHDETVDRTTDGQGRVGGMSLEELQSLDAGYRFTPDGGFTYPWRGRGVRVPTLEEVLTTFPEARFLIEIKENAPGMPEAVLAVVDAMGARDRVVLASFHDEVIRRVRELAPGIPTGHASGEALRLVVLQRLGLAAFAPPVAEALQVPEWHGPLRVANPGLARLARRQGLAFHVWTVNEVEDMYRIIGLGANGLITDYPDRLRQVLEVLGRNRPEHLFY